LVSTIGVEKMKELMIREAKKGYVITERVYDKPFIQQGDEYAAESVDRVLEIVKELLEEKDGNANKWKV